MSDSSFRRHSRAATGRTPRQTVGVLRLDAPSQPLLSGPQSFRNISRMVGGDSETALPWLFRTHYGLTG